MNEQNIKKWRHLELLTKTEAHVVLKFWGKRFIGLEKLPYLYQVTFFKKMNGSVLKNEGKLYKSVISMQNNNKIFPNKSNAVY
jgi:hypothetical protein